MNEENFDALTGDSIEEYPCALFRHRGFVSRSLSQRFRVTGITARQECRIARETRVRPVA
jgi:hypothetical protein